MAILNNVFYEVDSHALNADSFAELDRLASFMSENPGIKLEVSGHTDNTGTETYNLELSEKRAESVVEYLLGLGIETERLSAVGYGFYKPLSSNDTEEGRALNRRTEIQILMD